MAMPTTRVEAKQMRIRQFGMSPFPFFHPIAIPCPHHSMKITPRQIPFPLLTRLHENMLITNTILHDFQKLEKQIPDTPKGETPVHLRTKQIYAHQRI